MGPTVSADASSAAFQGWLVLYTILKCSEMGWPGAVVMDVPRHTAEAAKGKGLSWLIYGAESESSEGGLASLAREVKLWCGTG